MTTHAPLTESVYGPLSDILVGYARDLHPRVSPDEMANAIADTEAHYGCDSDAFCAVMEEYAISLAVEHRVAHEHGWFDTSED